MQMLTRPVRAIAKSVRPTAREDMRRYVQQSVKTLASHSWSRKGLNVFYRRLSLEQMRSFHERYSKLFREAHEPVNDGTWTVNLAGHKVVLPLTSGRFWLDWDTAVSFLGHETWIKQTYISLLQSSTPPNLFVDVGTNYGTHSLLFLVHGVETISFEPNAACHEYFRKLCAANGIEPRILEVALTDCEGWTELWFPENETWLGTISLDVKQKLESQANLVSRRVKQSTLDHYLADVSDRRILVKIDTEGHEYQVLRGAVRTLERCRPLLILESHPGGDRLNVFNFLKQAGYGLAGLPWSPDRPTAPFDLPEFLETQQLDFIAVPAERIRS